MSSFQITQIFFLPFYASVKARTPFLLGAIFQTFVLAKIWNLLIVFSSLGVKGWCPVVVGSGQKILTREGLGHFFVAPVGPG